MAQTIGILGGGQLGALLGQAALSLKHNPVVLVQNLDETAVSWGLPYELHSFHDIQGVRGFLERVDVVLFENEFFPPALQDIAKGLEYKFRPSLDLLLKLQNKATQKQIFQKLQLPSAPFEIFTGKTEELEGWLQKLQHENKAFVLKWAFGGYDGKGVLKFSAIPEALEFCQAALKKGAQIYKEDFVPYSLELAMVGARNKQGEFCHYPLVCSKQERAICKWVTGPAVSLGISPELEKQAIHMLQRFAVEMDMVGTFAVEFFLSPQAELLINEVAPRVHNSAHYTLSACDVSQFQLHIKAALGEKLAQPACSKYFGMLNLIGNTYVSKPQAPAIPGAHALYWYEKRELRALRKMGHVNTLATTAHELENNLLELKNIDDAWLSENLAKGKTKR